MIELFLALLVIPAVTIAIWDRVLQRLPVNARRAYRLTGYIGVPIHELSHAIVCILFRMRIKRISFYQPNSATTGTMGFVDFRYSPLSLRHAIGLAVQGLAPLLAGAALVSMLLNTSEQASPPGAGYMAVLMWVPEVAGGALNSAYQTASSGWWGLGALLLAMIISMHAIPSVADVLLGIRGLIMLVAFSGAAVLMFDVTWLLESQIGAGLTSHLRLLADHVETGLWMAIYAAVTMVMMSIVGGFLLILLPAVGAYIVSYVRGARGKV